MTAIMDERHRKEVTEAYAATKRLQLAAEASAVLGVIAFIWTIITIAAGTIPVSEGIIILAGTALATVVPAA